MNTLRKGHKTAAEKSEPRTFRTTPRAQDAFIGALRDGYSVRAACDAAGIGRSTAYELRETDAAFAARWVGALEDGSDLIEDEARRRAVEGVEEPVVSQGRIARNDDGSMLYVRKYSDTLMTQILKARRPEKYRDKVDHTLGNADGKPFQTQADTTLRADLTVEQLRILEGILAPPAEPS